jgi:hypothetical protein
MRYIRLFASLFAVLLLQYAATNAAQSTLRSKASGAVNDRLQSAISSLPAPVRGDAESLINTGNEAEERRLIEKLSDSGSDAIRDIFVDRLVREPLASVRLELLEYLIRNPRPDLRNVFEQLAKSDPDPDVAIAALEGVRAVEVQQVRQILTERLD